MRLYHDKLIRKKQDKGGPQAVPHARAFYPTPVRSSSPHRVWATWLPVSLALKPAVFFCLPAIHLPDHPAPDTLAYATVRQRDAQQTGYRPAQVMVAIKPPTAQLARAIVKLPCQPFGVANSISVLFRVSARWVVVSWLAGKPVRSCRSIRVPAHWG